LAVALASLAVPGGIAAADQSSSPIVVATVYKPGGVTSPESVSLAQLESDPQQCPAYSEPSMTEYRQQGPIIVDLPQNGSQTGTWPLSSILSCLAPAISPNAVTGLTVINSDGSPEVSADAQIVPGDLASPSDFANTAETAVVSDLGSAIQYNRPWRGGTDYDYHDEVTEPTGSPVTLEVYEGHPLTVNATASATSVSAGSTISFSATVGGANGSTVSYDWSFGDGGAADSTAPDPQAQFSAAGTYDVALRVTDSDGGGGATTIPITVTSASETQPATTTGPTRTGPAASPGTTPGGNPPTTPQSTTPPAKAQPQRQHQKRSVNTHTTPAATPTRSGHPPTAATTTPSAGALAGNGTSGNGTSGSASAGRAPTSGPPTATSAQPGPARSAAPHRPQRRTPERTPAQAPVVTGRLISDVIPLSSSASPLVHVVSSRSAVAAPERRHVTRAALVPVLAAVLGILLIFGLGARRELRGPGAWRMLRVSG
jgi:hypothetical protein